MPISTNNPKYFPLQIINHFYIRQIYGKNLIQVMHAHQNELVKTQKNYRNDQLQKLYTDIQVLQTKNDHFLKRCAKLLPKPTGDQFLQNITKIQFNQAITYWQCVKIAYQKETKVQAVLDQYPNWDQTDFKIDIKNDKKLPLIEPALNRYFKQALQIEAAFANSIKSIKEE